MPTVYEKADEDLMEFVGVVMDQYHQPLVEVEANIGVLMASHDGEGSAVKLHGYPCQAVIRVRNLKDRVLGMPDAEIVIDAKNWDDLTKPERIALIDHELHHLEVMKDENGNPKSDDIGRPKFKMRKHDHEFGWFDTIAIRHADASAEVKQAKAFADEFGQVYFGWATPPEREVETATLGGKKEKVSA